MSKCVQVEQLSIGVLGECDDKKTPAVVSVRINGEEEFVMGAQAALGLINALAKGLNAVQDKMMQSMQQQSSIILPGVSRERQS